MKKTTICALVVSLFMATTTTGCKVYKLKQFPPETGLMPIYQQAWPSKRTAKAGGKTTNVYSWMIGGYRADKDDLKRFDLENIDPKPYWEYMTSNLSNESK